MKVFRISERPIRIRPTQKKKEKAKEALNNIENMSNDNNDSFESSKKVKEKQSNSFINSMKNLFRKGEQ